MTLRLLSTALLASLVTAAANGATAPPSPSLFAPGVISGPDDDGGPTFTPDGRTLFFTRSANRHSTILQSHHTRSGWSSPEPAAFDQSGSNQQPALAPDGQSLIYVSTRKREAAPGAKPVGYSHLWRVRRTASGWSAPKELPAEINISDLVFRPSVAANGDLYFMAALSSDASGPLWRLYRAAKTSSGYARAEPLSFSDGKSRDVDPFIAPNGAYLIFASQGRRTPDDGHEHLYISRRAGTGWTPPRPIVFAGDDQDADSGEPSVSPDGHTLYFIHPAMQRPTGAQGVGGEDVWRLPFPRSS